MGAHKQQEVAVVAEAGFGLVESPGTEVLPRHAQEHRTTRRGQEDMGIGDMLVPRLEVVQATSKCRKPHLAEYIPGIQEGDLYNTLTRRIYGKVMQIVPVCTKKEWIIWKDHLKGGGIRGVFANEGLAEIAYAKLEDMADCDIQETYQIYSLHVEITNGGAENMEWLVISCAKSKRSSARQLNALIDRSERDSFAQKYTLTTILKPHPAGDYFNYIFTLAGFSSDAAFLRGEALYEAIQGNTVTISREDAGGGEGTD